MSRKGQSITLSISEQEKAQLEQMALDFGMTWGDRPNISKLIKAIAKRKLLMLANDDWSSDRIQALNQARIALIDAGQINTALSIANLLIDRSELTIPLRNELETFIQRHIQPWRLEIDRYIRRQKPFQLSYQDAQERIWQFTIRHAHIATHEDRQYLDCWCEETDGSKDLPELAHNRCLRLDRIMDAAIGPTSGAWRSELGFIKVELYLYRGLAHAYRSKTTQDDINEWHSDLPQVRRVVRQVTSTFWFIREILRYGKDCEIRSPEIVRDRMKQELQGLCDNYGLLEPK
jgi:hypothetical protein